MITNSSSSSQSMGSLYRLSEHGTWPKQVVNQVINADAVAGLKQLPDECVALAVTSPPYWNTVDYGVDGQIGHTSYEEYLQQLLCVWRETYRVLIPNGKL